LDKKIKLILKVNLHQKDLVLIEI